MKEKLYFKYAIDVVEGNIVAGVNIKLACQRFLNDLKSDNYEFREDKVERCLNFIKSLKHFRGKSSGKAFELEGWQQFIVANVIGIYIKGTKHRKYTQSYIEVSRKNGKTALAAALCLYFLIADGEDGAEVDLAANSKEQATIAFEFCYNFSKQLDPKGHFLNSKLKGINFKINNSKLKVFASDASKLDGFNASFALIDEFHAAPNSKVKDVIKSSMGMRENPHLMVITTAGFSKTSPCYQMRTTAIEVLNGIKEDENLFILIYSLDEGDDWKKEENWIKCTPNLNVTVTSKYIREQVKSAINNHTEEVGVKTKTLNLWCESSEVWISENKIVQNSSTINLKEFEGEVCYVGVDLSATSDLTAVSYLILKDDIYHFKVDYYLPESALEDNPNRELYKKWKRTGELKITNGNVTDYDYITNDLLKRNEFLRIYKVGYDKWNATQWAIDATDKGLPLEEFSQSIGNFNQPTKELERLILSNKVKIDNNEITRWCFRNVNLKSDWNDNTKPVKSNHLKKIDGVIAMIQSLGIFLQNPTLSNNLIII
jgi:phage terminase|nr:MAG TPA: Large Terminase [Siphoviridae sp. ctTYz13]